MRASTTQTDIHADLTSRANPPHSAAMREPATASPTSEPRGAITLTLLLCLVAASRLVALEWDPPAGILSHSGDLMTDEGFYLKAAVLWQRWGTWRNAHDLNWYPVSPLYAALSSVLVPLFDTPLLAMRAVVALCSVAGLAAWAWAVRKSLGSDAALMLVALVALAFDQWAFARLAFMEPLAIATSLGALALWVRAPQKPLHALASCLLAAATTGWKLSFAFTLVTCSVLWLWSARQAWQKGARTQTQVLVGVVALAWLCTGGAWLAMARLSHGDLHAMQRVLGPLVYGETSVRGVARNLAQAAQRNLLCPERVVLTLAGALLTGVALLGRKHAGPLRVQAWPARSPALFAIGLWGLLGLGVLGAGGYQPERWFVFLSLPLATAVVSLIPDSFAPWQKRMMALGILGLHVTAQMADLHAYVRRPDHGSLVRMAAAAAREMDADTRPEVPVLGNQAALVALWSHRLRPIADGFAGADPEGVCGRVRFWRPAYYVGTAQDAKALQAACAGDFAGVTPVATFAVLGDYMQRGPVVLLRLQYP
jgi:hypothetical protein